MPRLIVGLVVIAAAAVLAAPAGRAAPKDTPDITVGQCIEHGGTVGQPEGSPIRTCCMDSDITGIRGCYICDYKWENCIWDPAYRSEVRGQVLQGSDDLSVKPEGQGGTKPLSPPVVRGTLAPLQAR
ncbi:MAG: hypothetical protein IRY94_10805 [Rhodospirillaceae bacterium]|nr:hypothetical protein [Rhodospirillaceae bacterium]